MRQVWSDLDERYENKFTQKHTGMGNLQFRSVDGLVAVEKNVQIDQPRAFGQEFLAAHAGLDSAQSAQQIQWRNVSFGLYNAIQEPGLLAQIHGLSLIERRDACNAHSRISKRGNRGSQIFLAVS